MKTWGSSPVRGCALCGVQLAHGLGLAGGQPLLLPHPLEGSCDLTPTVGQGPLTTFERENLDANAHDDFGRTLANFPVGRVLCQ